MDNWVSNEAIDVLCEEIEFYLRLYFKEKDEKQKDKYSKKVKALIYTRGLVYKDRDKEEFNIT